MSLQHEGFSRALRALVAASPVSLKRTLKAEAGSILKACAGRTKVASADAITRNERLRIVKELRYNHERGDLSSEGKIGINVGIRGDYGKIWQTTTRKDGTWGLQQTHGPGFKPLNRHFGAKRWSALQTAIAEFRAAASRRVPMAKKSAGLARQSWVQIADSLGIALENVPGGGINAAGLRKAREALTSTGRAVRNGFSEEEGRQHGFILHLVNGLPYGRRAGLDAVLELVLAGRAAFFEQNLARGVFDDQAKLLRAYPGLTIHHSA